MVNFYNLSRDATPAAWSIGVPKDADVDRARALIEGNNERFRAELGDRMIGSLVYKGMIKVDGGVFNGDQYTLLYNTYCKVEDWEDIGPGSLEIAYKILVENGIQPFSGEQLPL